MINPLVITQEQVLSVERCCNSVCVMSTDKGPHWGDVSVFDEEYWEYENGDSDYCWVHSCEGHPDYDEVVPPPEDCTTIRYDDELWEELAKEAKRKK